MYPTYNAVLPWAPQPQPRTAQVSARKGKDSTVRLSEQRRCNLIGQKTNINSHLGHLS